MKLVIAGSRTFESIIFLDVVPEALNEYELNPTEIISGGARGIDEIGEVYAKLNDIPLKVFPADWETHGKAAGPIRNKQMADYGDAALVIWDGRSRGSRNMINTMKKLNKPVYEVIV